MAARKKESNLGKDKRPVCPSNIPVPGQGSRRHSLGSALPNKSTTKCPISDGFVPTTTKNVQKTAPPQSQRPDPLRRSDARPASVQKKSLVSPKPTTTRSSSFPSKLPSCIPKPTFEKVAKTPIAAKPSTLSSPSKTTTRNIKAAAPSPRPSIKRGTTTSSALKKPSHDKKQAKKLENKEISDHQAEEVVRDEIHDIQMPKAEEETQQHAQVEEKYMLDDVSTLTHQEPRSEEMEDKFHEQEHDGSNSSDHSEEAKNNDSEEEIDASHDEQENITHEETKIETQDKEAEEGNTTEEEVASTKESEEENSDQGNEQELEEEANLVGQSQAEAAYGEKETIEEEANLVPASQVEADADATHGKNESVEEVPKSQVQVEAEAEAAALPKEETNMVPESQVQKETVVEEKKANSVAESQVQAEAGNGKNEAPTPNSDVVEVPASKPVIARKGRVRALVGAFESHA